jgi:anti-anti-sigma factor
MHPGRTPFDLTIAEHDGLTVMCIAGELDCATAPLLSEALAHVAEPGRVVLVDMHDTEFVDCAGLAPLVAAYERQRELGGDLILDSPRGEVSRAIALTQLDSFIPVVGRTAPVELLARETR